MSNICKILERSLQMDIITLYAAFVEAETSISSADWHIVDVQSVFVE